MREAFFLFGVNVVLSVTLVSLGWTFLMPSQENVDGIASLIKKPWLLLLLGVIVAPLWEDLAFRGLPSLLLRRVRRHQNREIATRDAWFWTLGIVSSLAFSVLHAINDKGEIHLPLPQLLIGFFLWHVAIARGLRFSILLHATYNGIAMLLVLLAGSALQKTAPPPKIKAILVVQTATTSTRCRVEREPVLAEITVSPTFRLQLKNAPATIGLAGFCNFATP